MIKCGEDCIPARECCKYVYRVSEYIEEIDEFVSFTCNKGNEEVYTKDYCEEFHCLNAERNGGKC